MQAKKRNAKMTVKKTKKRARASVSVAAKPRSSPTAATRKKLGKKTESEKPSKTAAAGSSKTLLIAQEVKFARLLANNDKKVRDKVLKNLKKWLTVRSQSSFEFTEADFMRLWKGLFYCMWMSDKALVQEDLAESLSKIVHCFNSMDTALLYTKCTLKSLAAEWFGIDRYRIDKFEMLIRKIIRQTFEMCKNQSWNKQWVVGVAKVIEEILLDPKTCLGLKLHIADVYMEELAKISEGQIPKNMVTEFIRPFVIYLACMNDLRQIKHVVKNIFRYLIFQSDVGMDYTEKFNVWRQAGFPCQSIDELQKVEVSDNEDENDDADEINNDNEAEIKPKPLDPRAGRVDVEIPQLPFNPAEIAKILKENKFHKSSTTKTRKFITRLINDFTKLSEGDMPFGIKEIPVPDTTRINSYEATEDLLNLDKELHSDSSKNSRKRKKNGTFKELENTDNIEEILVPQNFNEFDIIDTIDKINKKQKLDSDSSDEVSDDDISKKQSEKQKSKVKLTVKKQSKKLNASEPLLKKKVKKSSKKLNNTVTEFIENNISSNTDDTSISKSSTGNNWSIDEASTPSVSTNSDKVLIEKKSQKTAKKDKITADQDGNTKVMKSNIPWLTPVLTRLEEQTKSPTPTKSAIVQTPKTDSAKKRVKIMLQRNMAQNTSEYIRQIRQSPAIPFDANRKPKAGVLKPSPLPSPVNPFYKKKIF